MTYVWIVSIGELGQGGSVHGVFSNLEDAKVYAAQKHANFLLAENQPENFVLYYDSSDFLHIKAHRVQ
jgi:hypothetical protein